MTGLKGAARNPTALTALRPAGSCNSAVFVHPSSVHFILLKTTGFLFDFFNARFQEGVPLFSGRGCLKPTLRRFRSRNARPLSGKRSACKPCPSARCFLTCFPGQARTGRITVWNTRIAAHRTTTHFFRHPHPPRAGVVLVLIQYHATRPGGIAAPSTTPAAPNCERNKIFFLWRSSVA